MKLFMRLRYKFPPKYYQMPNKYRDSLFLANASLFNTVHWFIHRAYEIIFPELVENQMKTSRLNEKEASRKILNIMQILDQCTKVEDIRYSIRNEKGLYDMIRAYRVNHGLLDIYPLSIGGLRINDTIIRDEMKCLSVLSTHRLAALNIKANGAFGGIKIKPDGYNFEKMKEIAEKYSAICLRNDCKKYIFEPDLNSGIDTLNYLNNTLKKKKSESYLSAIDGRETASSQGAFFGIEYFIKNDMVASSLGFSKNLSDKTFILQGLGKMGYNLAIYLQNAGAKCVGVKEYDAHVVNKDGIDIHEIMSHKETHGSIRGFQLAKPVDDYEIYKEDCDILILAAKQKSIVCHMAKTIKAKLIVEASYLPITPSAYMVLKGQSKIILPDVLICSGSAVMSYLEYLLGNHDCKHSASAIYGNILETLRSSESKAIAHNILTSVEQAGMKNDIITYATEMIIKTLGKEILDTSDKYDLGFDFKMATFLISIRNIFDDLSLQKNLYISRKL